jgi:hypothetical protein
MIDPAPRASMWGTTSLIISMVPLTLIRKVSSHTAAVASAMRPSRLAAIAVGRSVVVQDVDVSVAVDDLPNELLNRRLVAEIERHSLCFQTMLDQPVGLRASPCSVDVGEDDLSPLASK